MLSAIFDTPQSILESLHFPAFLLTTDEQGNGYFLESNRLGQKQFFAELEQPVDQKLTTALTGAQGLEFEKNLQLAWERGTPTNFEFSVHHPYYSQVFRINLQPLKGVHSKYLLATALEITDAVCAKAENTKMAIMVSEMEATMLSAAHDLQDPIEHLTSLSKKLKDNFKDLGDGKLQLLDQVEVLSKDTLSMIEEVVNHSQKINHSAGATPRFDLRKLCHESLEIFDPYCRHTLQTNSTYITSDPRAVRVAIATLFENSIKHNPERELILSVTTTRISNERLMFTVCDNGVGIKDNAFSPKQQRQPTLSLLELRNFLEQHDGKMVFESQKNNKGMAVSFELPGTLKCEIHRDRFNLASSKSNL